MFGSEFDLQYKILLLGDSGVGKSSIIQRYTENTFDENILSSIGVDFKSKTINYNEEKIMIQIWDTAGQERFRTITTSYYRGAQGIAIVFDITDKSSFDHVEKWLNEINKFAKENVLKFLIGNKIDLNIQRIVSYQTAEGLAKRYNIPYIETSAKDSTNVTEFFAFSARKYYEIVKSGQGEKPLGVSLNTALLKKGSKSGCCS